MRHRKKTLKLNRTPAHRRAMFANLVSSFILKEKVVTTVSKARAAAPLAEKMITLAKRGTLSARRRALSVLRDKAAVAKLFSEVGGRFAGRSGGYTRIIKMAFPRRGDGARTAVLMLVEGAGAQAAPEKEKKSRAERPASAESEPKAKA